MDTVKGCKTDKAGAVVVGNHKVYKMAASSEEDRNDWIRCIEEAMKDNHVHRIISKKKEASNQHSSENSYVIETDVGDDVGIIPTIVVGEP